MDILSQISELIQKGNAKQTVQAVEQALCSNITPKEILEDGLLCGMNIIGGKFKRNEVFVPEVLIAARAMNKGIEVLKPHLVSAGIKPKGTVILGTVKGDLHDIGKNLVKMMLEGKGLEVIDIGTDVDAEKFIDAAIEKNADIIAASALLTTTMGEMKNIVAAAERRGLKDKVVIMIGGAPITQAFCESIGADYYTPDAASCADVALSICDQK